MNLSQLYYFRKLAELQHYAKAAKELYITQPSLSNAISSLEQELGVSLFQKTGRNIHLTKYGGEGPRLSGGGRRPTIELPYAPAPDPAACGGFLERLPAASAADCADSIELSYDVVGGFDANALRVFWKVREAGCEPRWFALKAFTGMQLKYVLPGKRAPIVFALGDEDAYAYCDEDPCVGCTFRCKRGFELYAYVEKIGLVAQSVHREAVTR